jgi:hypothetical protein
MFLGGSQMAYVFTHPVRGYVVAWSFRSILRSTDYIGPVIRALKQRDLILKLLAAGMSLRNSELQNRFEDIKATLLYATRVLRREDLLFLRRSRAFG